VLECSWCRYVQMSRRLRWDAGRCMTQPYMGGATMSAQPEVQHAHAAEQYRHTARPYQEAAEHQSARWRSHSVPSDSPS